MYQCVKCGFETSKPSIRCPRCGGLLIYRHGFRWSIDSGAQGIWKFRSMLPGFAIENSLSEGSTPLIPSNKLSGEGVRVYYKDEGRNPTGSFRDRVAALLTSHAYSLGYKGVVCATDGNMGASLAAYSTRLGLKAKAIVPRGSDWGKIVLMKSLGAEVIEHGESLDDVLVIAEKIADDEDLYNATAELNALSIEALKTIAFEITLDIGRPPDTIIVPVGSGLTLYSIYYGFREMLSHNVIRKLPRIVGVETCWNPRISIAMGYKVKACRMKPVIGLAYHYPPFENEAVEAIRSSGGDIVAVGSAEIFSAAEELARKEGLFVEPAAAAALAGYYKALDKGTIDEGIIVIVLTGHGLKAVGSYMGGNVRRRGLSRIMFSRDTKLEIIRLLYNRGGLNGYSIWRELGLKLTVQAIYQHLNELERKGILVSRIIDGKKYYYLSNKGLRIASLIEELYSLLYG